MDVLTNLTMYERSKLYTCNLLNKKFLIIQNQLFDKIINIDSENTLSIY